MKLRLSFERHWTFWPYLVVLAVTMPLHRMTTSEAAEWLFDKTMKINVTEVVQDA